MGVRLGPGASAEAYNGSPSHSQNVSVTSTTGRQASAFVGGEILLIVNDGSTKCYFATGTSTVEVTTSNGVPLAADEKMIVTLTRNDTHIAFITSSGTTTARLYKMI